MNTAARSLVWYVSYGSNLNRERFLCYIRGGRPSGAKVTEPGCTDQTLPRDDRAVMIRHQLYFAAESAVWDGGVAFIGKAANTPATLARAYLITLEQFFEVVQQENKWPDLPPTPTLTAIKRAGHVDLTPLTPMGIGSKYSRLVYCDDYESYPMLSMTSPFIYPQTVTPSAPYIAMLAEGLQQCHNVTAQEAARYLHNQHGITGNYNLDDLLAIAQPMPDTVELIPQNLPLAA